MMRNILMTEELYNWIGKMLENDAIQNICNNELYGNTVEEYLTQAYELFHKKRKLRRE